ncbi:MAG: isoprenylcysteine carboxylmethyltransferase family protein [Pirellulales bacterium]
MNYPTTIHAARYQGGIAAFLVRRRVPISLLLFTGLILEDIIFWTKPNHGWSDEAGLWGYLGAAFVVLGAAVRSWAAGTLRKGIDLTTAGPYSLCRNPLYLGSFLVMIGFCTLIGFAHDFFVVCGPIAVIYALTVLAEERRLAKLYAAHWRTYEQTTPRFLPWKVLNFQPGAWTLEQWQANREYNGLAGIVVGLLALETWRLYG